MIGERLSELRKDIGLSQGELAERLGLAASTISAYERGVNEPDDETKLRIAELFNISLDYLLGAIDEELPLHRRGVLQLPRGLSDESVTELKKYMELLALRDRQPK